MNRSREALIVGAGVGGLAAGIALKQAGWRVRVFERAAQARELGFALNLAPNAMAALRELGVADTLMAEGVRPGPNVEMRGAGGSTLRRLTMPAALDRVPSVVGLRPVLHGALLNGLGPDALELSCDVVGFDAHGGSPSLRFADGSTAAGDVIIGADGVASVIRRHLHPEEGPPRRSGYVAIRGVAHDAEHLLGDLGAVAYFAPGIESAMVRAGRRAVYWYMSLLARDLQPMPAIEAIVERVGDGFDDQYRRVVHATRREDMRLDELFDRAPIDNWGSGPVTLLGDAAHPMLPHAGQGAAQALEDAVALGIVLAKDVDLVAALRHYESVRSARIRGVVAQARRIARMTTTRNPLIAWARNTGVRLAPASAMMSAFFLTDRGDPHRELRSWAGVRGINGGRSN